VFLGMTPHNHSTEQSVHTGVMYIQYTGCSIDKLMRYMYLTKF